MTTRTKLRPIGDADLARLMLDPKTRDLLQRNDAELAVARELGNTLTDQQWADVAIENTHCSECAEDIDSLLLGGLCENCFWLAQEGDL